MMTIAKCLRKSYSVTVFWDNKKDIQELQNRFLLDLTGIELSKNIFSPKVSTLERFFKTSSFDAIFILSDGGIPFVASKKLFLHFQQPMQHIKLLSRKTKIKLRRVSKIFCNSQFTKSYIDKTFQINSKVIYPPVDFHIKKTDKENMILHVGRFRVRDVTVDGFPIGDYKKQAVMIDAFKQMIQSGLTGWRFVVGVSVQKDEFSKFAAMQKSAEGFPIEFVVNQNNKKLWDVYNKAKIYWHASGFGEDTEKHPEYAEHFGISTVEAMAAGAVPVVINAGGQKEIVDDGENGFRWDSITKLKEKTQLLISDAQLLQKLAKHAQEKASKFTSKNFYNDIYELLES